MLAYYGIEDFEVENIAEEILRAEKEIRVILRDWSILLASLAAISLLVGGVGIYSVLRISLAERLYEIGLRKAIGASNAAILAQILVESTGLPSLAAWWEWPWAWLGRLPVPLRGPASAFGAMAT